jgi:hypothetical protein
MSHINDIEVWLLLFANGIPYVLFLRDYQWQKAKKEVPLTVYQGCIVGFSAWWLIAVLWVSPWIFYRLAGNDILTSIFYGFLTGSVIAILVIHLVLLSRDASQCGRTGRI